MTTIQSPAYSWIDLYYSDVSITAHFVLQKKQSIPVQKGLEAITCVHFKFRSQASNVRACCVHAASVHISFFPAKLQMQ